MHIGFVYQADVITPNQFETEKLTGVTIKTTPDAKRACGILHDIGVPTVLITSITFQDIDEQLHDGSNSIAMFTSQRNYNTENKKDFTDEQYILYAPFINGHFTGTGDICAALFLAWTAMQAETDSNENGALKSALEKLGGTMHAIVKRTADYAEKMSQSSSASQVFSREMRLIQSRDDILTPPKLFDAIRVAP